MHSTADFKGLSGGRFDRKRALDREQRPGEVARIVERAKRGDELAMRQLYVRFAGNVYGYARSILRDEHEAEDVTQQVFTRLMTAIHRFEDRSVPFSAWLLRIAHNTAIDHLRRRMPLSEDTQTALEPERIVERTDELAMAIREALEKLPDGQREIVVLRHVGGYSPVEIAERLGRSEQSVHGLHHRGRRALKAALMSADAMPATQAA